MSKKSKKKNKSGGNHGVNGGNEVLKLGLQQSLQQKKDDFDQQLKDWEVEKQIFLDEIQERESALVEAKARIQAIEEDEEAYIQQVRQEKSRAMEEELEALHQEESKRILAEQEEQRLKLAEEWNQRGATMDQQMRERLAKTDALVEEREVEFVKKEKQFREECLELQKNQRTLQEKQHQMQLDFQEKEATLHRELEMKAKQLEFEQEEVLMEQGQLRGMITRLQAEKVRTEQSYEQQLLDSQRRCGGMEDKYDALWQEHEELQGKLREFHQELGGDLQSYHNKTSELTRRNQELEQELSLSVPRSVEEDLKQLRQQFTDLMAQRSQWENSVVQYQNLELQNQEISHQLQLSQGEVRFLESNKEQIMVENTNMKEKVEELMLRYCTPSVLNEDASRRVAQILQGYQLNAPDETFPKDYEEMDWVKYILRKCRDAQMEFPLRVFLAFHTAMKISDWSIVTVLAGVSGTGKSKLPELYATYGGLNFIAVPVQEHWNSQESMLGFFNTMENRFEAEPLLRFLLSAIEVPPDRKGVLENQLSPDMDEAKRLFVEDGERTVSLVLLDEMNLAHVEEYFAEFLSKLENRRGLRDVPSIDVKLGTGIPDYPLKLRRNILWTGTMNQDETTKSLSDKVLDRGVVINYPRPEVFLRRESQRVQGSGEFRLPYKLWRKWQTRDTSYSVQVEDVGDSVNLEAKYEMLGAPPEEPSDKWSNYKGMLEHINRLMTKEGRALGHRVWQATEYYVVNHPLVIYEMNHSYDLDKESCVLTPALKAALHLAVEDQLVQKILPKLRGVEYYENGTLDEIGSVIGKHFPNLREDYQRACEQGQGQFMWATSSYGENGKNNALLQWLERLDCVEASSEIE